MPASGSVKPFAGIISIWSHKVGGEEGIRTLVGLLPNGFQDRLVMTTSIPLQVSAVLLFLIGTFGMIPVFLIFVNRKFHFFSKKFSQW